MRCVRMAVAGSIVLAVLGTSATPAIGAPGPSATPLPTPVPAPVAPSTVCTIPTGSHGAGQLTGLVATSDGYVVIDGHNPNLTLRIFYLDKSCNRTATQQYSSTPFDPQDLAVDSNGVLWVADIGDDANAANPQRTIVSLYKVTSQSSMTHYKFTYPDGAHNAGAFLLDGKGHPIFVTKSISGPGLIYTYTGSLSTSQAMTLTKAGQFQPEQTGTANKLGDHSFAQTEITGGANAPGGKKVALRTWTDAYEWDVSNGDVIGAITKKTPRITPMPNEDQGYAIAYTTDGSSFLTVTDGSGPTPILKYKPAGAAAATAAAHKPHGPATPGALRKFFNQLTFRQLMILLGGVAVFGLLLLLIGILGIRRSREAYRAAEARAARADKSASGKAPIGAGVGGNGVYGSPRPPGSGPGPGSPGSGGGAVYGAPADPYDPYSDRPASGRSNDPYADPYAAPPPPPPSPSGGSPSGGNRGGGAVYGGQYGAPVDPYADGGHGHGGGGHGGGGHGGHGGGGYGGAEEHRPSPYGRPDDRY